MPKAVKSTLPVALVLPVVTVPELLATLTPIPCKFPEFITFPGALILIFPVDAVLVVVIFPVVLETSTAPPCKFPAVKLLVALKATVAVGALTDATLILVFASRLTVGVVGLTGFAAIGLTVIGAVMICCPATTLTSPVEAIAPVATFPVRLVAPTVEPVRFPTFKSPGAAKVTFSVAVTLAGVVFGTIVLGSFNTPRAPELLITLT
ncbi:MAG: hypothetical protein EAZ45_20680 [Oscillatoriales cyanobacterium]|nr:MAG: hypothetical protein EAZ45_20680 [Oscillatoriales cyanobacterium]